ncbi:hypothetical protein HYV74_00855 [Candidatus Uhrbacteria bacterium]|nr:hypothetical protein [Candidatus Uhrbacteria bacterium]
MHRPVSAPSQLERYFLRAFATGWILLAVSMSIAFFAGIAQLFPGGADDARRMTLLPITNGYQDIAGGIAGYAYLTAVPIIVLGHLCIIGRDCTKRQWKEAGLSTLMMAVGLGACGFLIPFVALVAYASGSILVLEIGTFCFYGAMGIIGACIAGLFTVGPMVALLSVVVRTIRRSRPPQLLV